MGIGFIIINSEELAPFAHAGERGGRRWRREEAVAERTQRPGSLRGRGAYMRGPAQPLLLTPRTFRSFPYPDSCPCRRAESSAGSRPAQHRDTSPAPSPGGRWGSAAAKVAAGPGAAAAASHQVAR